MCFYNYLMLDERFFAYSLLLFIIILKRTYY